MRQHQDGQETVGGCQNGIGPASLTGSQAKTPCESSEDDASAATVRSAIGDRGALCGRCRDDARHERAMERRIVASLRVSPDELADEALWARACARALANPSLRRREPWSRWLQHPRVPAQWIALVASLVFLAALASAGLGLRHGHDYVAPEKRPGQRAVPIVDAVPIQDASPGRNAGSLLRACKRAS